MVLPPPYGYEIVGKKLVPKKEESKWVKKMFRWFYDGKSMVWIKSQLDKNGVLARRGKLFSLGSINRLMKNTHYIGHYAWTDTKSGETVNCVCPTIVDETIWNEVEERRKRIYARKGQNNRTKKFYLLRNLMWCGECGSQMNGRIYAGRREEFYYCVNKERNWKKGAIPKSQKWKRGKVGEHGCNMVRSLNIPITDKFVWGTVIDTVSKSSILKEQTKKKVLNVAFKNDENALREIRLAKTKTQRLRKDLQQVQSSLADVETGHLLQEYDNQEIYKKIKSNLEQRYKQLKLDIEQERLKTKELGNKKLWMDWIAKYGDDLEVKRKYSDKDKKEYLEGLLRRIDVELDKETNDHHLNIVFKMPLVGDEHIWTDKTTKPWKYEVIEGATDASIIIPYEDRRGRPKKSQNANNTAKGVKSTTK